MHSHQSLSAPAGEMIDRPASEDRPTGTGSQEKNASPEGLCRTCDNRPECTFSKTEAAVLNCDELDYPSRQPEPGPCAPVLRPAPEKAPDEGRENLIGLCRTCENRFDCQFPKPAGGVWNCEEFV